MPLLYYRQTEISVIGASLSTRAASLSARKRPFTNPFPVRRGPGFRPRKADITSMLATLVLGYDFPLFVLEQDSGGLTRTLGTQGSDCPKAKGLGRLHLVYRGSLVSSGRWYVISTIGLNRNKSC
jgi:hypothetical protein